MLELFPLMNLILKLARFGTYPTMACITLKKLNSIVFDCVVRFGGTLLNEQMLTGPNLANIAKI